MTNIPHPSNQRPSMINAMRRLIAAIGLMGYILCGFSMSTLDISVQQKKIQLPYWQAVKKHKGSVILIQGDKPFYDIGFMHSLAAYLQAMGWSVVFLDLQFQDQKGLDNQLPSTITALNKTEKGPLILLHYGEQLQNFLAVAQKSQSLGVKGIIFLSSYEKAPKDNLGEAIKKLNLPILDLAGQFDNETVLAQTEQRQNSNYHSPYYQILVIPGATHQYGYTVKMVAKIINGWMMKLTPRLRKR